MWFALRRDVTLDLERRMFWAMVCLRVEAPAPAGVVEPLRLRDVEDWEDGLFGSWCEKSWPIVDTMHRAGGAGMGGKDGGCGEGC